MTSWPHVLLLLVLFAACVVALLICLQRLASAPRRDLQRVADRVLARISGPGLAGKGIWTGAFLVAIPRIQRARVQQRATSEAERGAPSWRILEVWQESRAELFWHVPGPVFTSDEDACDWVTQASDDLAKVPVDGAVSDGRTLFALVYASGEPPPTKPIDLGDLRSGVLGPTCIGAAFVACAEDAAATPAFGARARLVFAASALGVVAVGTVASIGFLLGASEPPGPRPDPGAVQSPDDDNVGAQGPRRPVTTSTVSGGRVNNGAPAGSSVPSATGPLSGPDPSATTTSASADPEAGDAGSGAADPGDGGAADAGTGPKLGASSPASGPRKNGADARPEKPPATSPAGDKDPFRRPPPTPTR